MKQQKDTHKIAPNTNTLTKAADYYFMTNARSEIYNPDEVGVYHCVSRCVRRAYLCGEDQLTGKSFEHRREWIRARLKLLIDIFAIEVIAYAVMSNHLHAVIRNRPDITEKWEDKEVARRWRKLFPLRRDQNGAAMKPSEAEIAAITMDQKKVALYRARLSDISWFNRCVNENIARRANLEDECTGRFWEGRFKCQRVYDLSAILACSVYVDLNPIRAGIAQSPEESDFTSIQDRIKTLKKQSNSKGLGKSLMSIEDLSDKTVTTEEYFELVEATGKLLRKNKASISEDIKPILQRLKLSPSEWIETTRKIRMRFPRVIGTADRIKEAAENANKEWFHGLSAARAVFI